MRKIAEGLTSAGRVMLAVVCLCAYVTTGSQVIRAQDNAPKDGRYYESLARKAYQEKDFRSFLENMKMAALMRPNHPRLMFNLAAAYALNGQSREALEWLGRMAAMGLVFRAEAESDFASIKDAAEFQTILKTIERNRAPVVGGAPAFTLHEKGFIPEGIAYDSVTGTFYLGSVHKRKIVSINARGEAKEFSSEGDGLWSVMGMKVDAGRRLLWVATAGHPQMANAKEEENGASGLFKYDLRTGKLMRKYLLPNKPKPHWLGDLVINSRGEVFATDSVTPAIYFLGRGQEELSVFMEGAPFTSPQGLALTPDEKHLFMADYSKGIFLIDLKTKKQRELSLAPNMTLLGIDGLYLHKGSLIAVQNGINPHRVVRLFLNSDLGHVERLEAIAVNDPSFDEPTLGVLVRDAFYLIANSQWGAIDQKGKLAAEDKLKEPVVLKIKL